MNIDAEVQEAIRKNLPSAVGDVLRKRLEQADADAAELEKQRQRAKELGAKVLDLETRLAGHAAISSREAFVAGREAAVRDRELKADLKDLEIKLQGERLNDLKQVVGLVFANNRFKYRDCGQEAVGGGAGMGPTTFYTERTREGEQ